jgi:membrane protease subunit (stomatin/prohibitin family)
MSEATAQAKPEAETQAHFHVCAGCGDRYECEDEGCAARATMSVCPDCLSF